MDLVIAIPKRLLSSLILQWMDFSTDPRIEAIFQEILSQLTIFSWEFFYAQQSGYGMGPRTDGCFGGDLDKVSQYCIELIERTGGVEVSASASKHEDNTYIWTHFKIPGSDVPRHIHPIIKFDDDANPPVRVVWR
jgi:hypothetical protein